MKPPAISSFFSLLALITSLFPSCLWALPLEGGEHVERAASWPFGPFHVSGAEMKNSQNDTIVYAGANWPGHLEVMIPEGLQYQSIESIVSEMKSVGMNAVRLTWAIQMVDEIYANNGTDTTVQQSFTTALGEENGTTVYNEFLTQNPSFNASTTRLEVFDAVAAECARQQIHVHLDNQMSTAEWCCSTDDGNAWWGDEDFSVANWTRGLAYMADHGQAWPALTSMALRNELREPDDDAALNASAYNWADWYGHVRNGSAAIASANADLLIFLSGLDFDTWLTPVVQGTALTPGNATYSAADFGGYADRLVLEIHNYDNDATDCGDLESSLLQDGFQALHADDAQTANVFPVVLTEFGFEQTAAGWESTYTTCLASFLAEQQAGWFIWAIAGSYYTREGTQDYDETWGLLTHDWSTWRSPDYVSAELEPLANATVQG
ncbi:glycoside hydrolase family 5 protein [Xylariaceae sp. FL0804]|nr:glycoside hydrolase family 5 protein [Xylariaceae sp. FL0804]